ncbi:MAG: hydrogenase maturation protease [Calditrichaeota bacterium]|nr:hydrogenase maturation protease [Calditrichota bacterium]
MANGLDTIATSAKSLLVLCLGNEILSDDGFGPEVARRLQKESEPDFPADVVFAPLAGFNLLDLLTERERVLIVDTIRTGKVAPGTLHHFPASALAPSHNLTTSHQINLPTALELSRRLSIKMPEVVDVLAVEAQNLETFSEQLTPPVRDAVEEAVRFILEWIQKHSTQEPS